MIYRNCPGNNKRTSNRSSAAFTLIEMLVVIALTVILLTVLFAPLIQAFQFTEQAQATAQAQDAARLVTEQITRELGSAAAVRDTTGNFLDLILDTQSGSTVIAHSYNAYIDIVPPRSQAGTIVDPTVDPGTATVNIGSKNTLGVSTELGSPGVGLPLSAGSTVVRYFPGLRYPINPKYVLGTTPDSTTDTTFAQPGDPQPYVNLWDGVKVGYKNAYYQTYVGQKNISNTYQLYRANFQPYVLQANGTSYGPNTSLFPVTPGTGAGGGSPILDDPDFFRVVLVGETDYVAGQGDNGTYTAGTAMAHNDRVFNWWKIAKEVISTRDIDLIGLPRAGKGVIYDSQGNPVDSYDSTGKIPLIRTTINFAPALISNDSMAASNSSNTGQGYGSAPNLLNPSPTSLPYVPTLYGGQYGNWQGIPAVTITKSMPSTTGPTLQVLQTRSYTAADQSSNYVLGVPNYSGNAATTPSVGDLVLCNVSGGALGTPVYDVTLSTPILPMGSTTTPVYDAMLIDNTRGVVSFAIPALPTPVPGAVQNPPNTYFQVTGPFNQYNSSSLTNAINLGDFKLLPGTPLPAPMSEGVNPTVVPNSAIVVNSERVVGPDMSAGLVGSATSDMVQYTRESPQTPLGANQYTIDYANNLIIFGSTSIPSMVEIAFSYQNNVTIPSSTAGSGSVNVPDTIDTVRASYYSAAIMRLNLGVRVYGGATGNSEYFSLNSQVGVGNAKAN